LRLVSVRQPEAVQSVSSHPHGVTISLHVQPKASRTALAGEVGGSLKLRVAAPPVDGAANDEIVRFLSKLLRVPKSSIEIVSGVRSRKKVVLITGIEVEEVFAVFDSA
jgi:uncharacterized protein